MLNFVLHGIGALICLGAGWYGHYRYGSSVKNAIAQVETRVQDVSKKL